MQCNKKHDYLEAAKHLLQESKEIQFNTSGIKTFEIAHSSLPFAHLGYLHPTFL